MRVTPIQVSGLDGPGIGVMLGSFKDLVIRPLRGGIISLLATHGSGRFAANPG